MAAKVKITLVFLAARFIKGEVTADSAYIVRGDISFNTVDAQSDIADEDEGSPSSVVASMHAFDAENFLALREDLWSMREEVTNLRKDVELMKHSSFRPVDLDPPQRTVAEHAELRYSDRGNNHQSTPEKCNVAEQREDTEMHAEAVNSNKSATDSEVVPQLLPQLDFYRLIRSLLSLFIRNVGELRYMLFDENREPDHLTV